MNLLAILAWGFFSVGSVDWAGRGNSLRFLCGGCRLRGSDRRFLADSSAIGNRQPSSRDTDKRDDPSAGSADGHRNAIWIEPRAILYRRLRIPRSDLDSTLACDTRTPKSGSFTHSDPRSECTVQCRCSGVVPITTINAGLRRRLHICRSDRTARSRNARVI
jgi:hypothetical protein